MCFRFTTTPVPEDESQGPGSAVPAGSKCYASRPAFNLHEYGGQSVNTTGRAGSRRGFFGRSTGITPPPLTARPDRHASCNCPIFTDPARSREDLPGHFAGTTRPQPLARILENNGF